MAPPTVVPGHTVPPPAFDFSPTVSSTLLEALQALCDCTEDEVWEVLESHIEPLQTLRATVMRWKDDGPFSAWRSETADSMLLLLDPEVVAESRQPATDKAGQQPALHPTWSQLCRIPMTHSGSELRRRADRGSNCGSRLAWGSRESLGLRFTVLGEWEEECGHYGQETLLLLVGSLTACWQILDVEDAFASLRDFHDVESIRCCACSRAFDGAPESAERAWARGLGGVCYRGEEGPDLGTGGLPEMEALRPERESILIPKSITGDNPGPIASFSYGCDDKRFYQ
ncbi:unnamed protein product [Symbiodinium sp. KB8]|nr:unnamed protein product [Symbiodinium sp. KB8]